MSRGATEEAAAGGSLTLRRGLRLLHVLAEHPDGLSISQLAAELDTHRAGVYRLLAPLIDERFVQRLADAPKVEVATPASTLPRVAEPSAVEGAPVVPPAVLACTMDCGAGG